MHDYGPIRFWLSALLLVCTTAAGAQIVNIEKKRIPTATPGWFGSVEFNFAGSKTTKSTLSIYAGGTLEYKAPNEKDFWLFDTRYNLVSGDNEKFSNTGYGYLLYNRKLSPDSPFRWEVFAMAQYNDLTKVAARANGGTGIRVKLSPESYKNAKFYFGAAYLFEYEELTEPHDYTNEQRLSSYFTFTLTPEENVSFISTTYVQPLLTDPSDYRFSNETTLSLGITKKLVLNTTFSYNFDKVPPVGVPNSTYYFLNGLEINF